MGEQNEKKERLRAQIDILDPLHEIRNRAKQLWSADGKPADRDWLDYFSIAEEQLLSGLSEGTPSSRTRSKETSEIDPTIRPLVEQQENTFLSILASVVKRPLVEYEAHCLADVLMKHKVKLSRDVTLGPHSVSQVAELLADLAGEYDPSFLKEQGMKEFGSIPRAARVQYWDRKLLESKAEDRPLTNADRNAVSRFKEHLRQDPRVADLIYLGGSAELG